VAAFSARSFGELGNLALHRVAGKPFAVSEYDHAWPSDFACEMYPTLASFACRQDWDALYPYTGGAYGEHNPDHAIRDYFDQFNHPAKWSQGPWAALVLRRGLIVPAQAAAELRLGSPPWIEQPHADLLWRKLTADDPLDFLDVRFATAPGAEGQGRPARIARSGERGPAQVKVVNAPQGKVFVVAGEQAAAAVGYLGGASIEAGPLTVRCARFGRDFASITAVALDERALRESARILVTVVARAENQAMGWNETRTSVGARWGHGPPIAERVPATITLPGSGERAVFALAPDGTRVRRVPATAADGILEFSVAVDDRTLHYEIVAP
jgi:hypothetical protein